MNEINALAILHTLSHPPILSSPCTSAHLLSSLLPIHPSSTSLPPPPLSTHPTDPPRSPFLFPLPLKAPTPLHEPPTDTTTAQQPRRRADPLAARAPRSRRAIPSTLASQSALWQRRLRVPTAGSPRGRRGRWLPPVRRGGGSAVGGAGGGRGRRRGCGGLRAAGTRGCRDWVVWGRRGEGAVREGEGCCAVEWVGEAAGRRGRF